MKNENKENYLENFLEKLEEIRLKRTLRLRGYTITESCSLNRVILPKKQDIKIWEKYYQLLSHYRFRRLVSDLIQVKTSGFIDLSLLLTKWTWEEISDYFKFLEEAGILERIGDKFYFLYDLIDNFGETLEWFIAQILKREFSIPAFWGVKLLGISGGGDFDVLGLVENYLLYIECKTSPPNNIRLRDLWEFLRRREVLGSQLTIFLIDTTLKVERNIVDNVKLLLDRRFSPYKKNEVIKEKEGVYFFSPNIFILQSKGDFVVNFQHVFRKFLEKVFNY